jgi:hypothetical protein
MHLRILTGVVVLAFCSVVGAAQQPAVECSNTVTFGEHPDLPSIQDAGRAVRVAVVYFRSEDPNAFISEAKGLNRSGSFRRMSRLEFASLFDRLSETQALAFANSDTKRATIGERLTFDDESTGRTELTSLNHAAARWASTSYAPPERRTELRVVRKNRTERDAYRLLLTSAAVEAKASRATGTVDLDVDVFLRPGETAIFKLTGDKQIARSGAARDYIAVTLLQDHEK